ncbi:MAG: hypothetical protein E7378_03390 [Clostridiales bacterium]|nr:hypothetical protein [Clostridiales bacterium]
MKITVLGTGGFAYPLVFCECDYCNKARILGGKNIRKRASILINDEMIIDLTPDCQVAMNMYQKDMGKVKYLLQTHTHLDHFDINHFTSLDYKYCTKKSKELILICSDECLKDIQNKASQFDRMDLYNEEYLNKIKLKTKTINHGEILSCEDYIIKPIYCSHDERIGAQLYLIKQQGKTLLYATDTPMLTDVTLQELKGEKIDCIFLDESFGVQDYTFSHLNIKGFDEYIKTLKQNNLLSDKCLVYATHITHDGNPTHEELNQILNKNGYNVAYDGLEFEL